MSVEKDYSEDGCLTKLINSFAASGSNYEKIMAGFYGKTLSLHTSFCIEKGYDDLLDFWTWDNPFIIDLFKLAEADISSEKSLIILLKNAFSDVIEAYMDIFPSRVKKITEEVYSLYKKDSEERRMQYPSYWRDRFEKREVKPEPSKIKLPIIPIILGISGISFLFHVFRKR